MSRIATVVIVSLVAVLLLGLIGLVATSDNNNNNNEVKYVDTTKLQAVFLNTGQVYFGKIKSLNKNYFVLTSIYYLQTTNNGSSGSTSSNSSSGVTLVKLGCELHEPFDQMVINSDQVTFWENLSDKGQVATAVKKWQSDNPEGQVCADQSSSSSSSSSSNVQNAPSNSSNKSSSSN